MNPIKFYADVHISGEAVRQLRAKGVDIIHGGEMGFGDIADEQHLNYAIEQGRVMVSCDRDFLTLDAQYQAEERQHLGIVYIAARDKCKSIGFIVSALMFLHEVADYEVDLFNQVWRA